MSNLYQIMRQLKSDKSQTSSVEETVQSPDKSCSVLTPTVHHRVTKVIEEDDDALLSVEEEISAPVEVASNSNDDNEDNDDDHDHDHDVGGAPKTDAKPHDRVENGGKLSSFLSRDVGTLSRDILVQGDSGSVVSELTFDHALRPLTHHQILSSLAARRIQEEVASCESGESAFTPRTRGNATAATSEEASTDYFHNSFQTSMAEDALPPLYERAHNTDDASVSGLHQPPITPSPQTSSRNLQLQQCQTWRSGSSSGLDGTDESLQYSEQDSAMIYELSSNDDQSHSLFSVSTPGYSTKSRSSQALQQRQPRVETVVEEGTQNDDSGNLDFIEADRSASNLMAAGGHYLSPLLRTYHRPYETDESVDFSSENDATTSETFGRRATYVSSTTESYVSTSFVSTSTSFQSSVKSRSTDAYTSSSVDGSVSGESSATNRASNIASDDSIDLVSLEEASLPAAADTNKVVAATTSTTTTLQSNNTTSSIEVTPANEQHASPRAAVDAASEAEAAIIKTSALILVSAEGKEVSPSPESPAVADPQETLSGPVESPTVSTVTGDDKVIENLRASAVDLPSATNAKEEGGVIVEYAAGLQDVCESKASNEKSHSSVNPTSQAIPLENVTGDLEGNETAVIQMTRSDEAAALTATAVAPVLSTSDGNDNIQAQVENRDEPNQGHGEEWSAQEDVQETNSSQESSCTDDVEQPTESHASLNKGKSQKEKTRCCSWKWMSICFGGALVLTALAVPAIIIIPLVIIRSSEEARHRNLRGVSSVVGQGILGYVSDQSSPSQPKWSPFY